MANNTELVELFRSMDRSLTSIAKMLAGMIPPAVAADRDLDGKFGNPKVTIKPRDWTGPECKGKQMSECPAAFLDLLAETLEYFARKADETNETYNGKPVAPYKRQDAARARGWAKRIREGRVTMSQAATPEPMAPMDPEDETGGADPVTGGVDPVEPWPDEDEQQDW